MNVLNFQQQIQNAQHFFKCVNLFIFNPMFQTTNARGKGKGEVQRSSLVLGEKCDYSSNHE